MAGCTSASGKQKLLPLVTNGSASADDKYAASDDRGHADTVLGS